MLCDGSAFTRDTARGLEPSLSLGVDACGGLIDPDATAYINAVIAAGATVSGTQRAAINTFIRAEKSATRWSSIKRLYLPIWASAAPNAICMVSHASGTFVGGVTHRAGYVQGNGSTGYFDFGARIISDLGMSAANGGLGMLVATGSPTFISETDWRWVMGLSGPYVGEFSGQTGFQISGNSNILVARYAQSASYVNLSGGSGIYSLVVRSGSGKARFRTSVGLVSNITLTSSSLPDLSLYALGSNVNGVASCSEQKLGAYWALAGMSVASEEGFTLSLKTLWETCTGLKLP